MGLIWLTIDQSSGAKIDALTADLAFCVVRSAHTQPYSRQLRPTVAMLHPPTVDTHCLVLLVRRQQMSF
jgi:hypothetical protein